MQVRFARSGGFAGLDLVATVNTEDLSGEQQDLVAGLLSGDLRDQDASRTGGADQFCYQLDIQHGDRVVRCQWEEPEVPDSVRPLLAALTEQATPVR